MPANNQRPVAQTPASPRNTAKYTNKDGSKFITVPKGPASESSQPSTPTTSRPNASQPEPDTTNGPAPTVNRKKQKRRQKAAAKAAAEQAAESHPSPSSTAANHSGRGSADHETAESDDEHEYVMGVGPPTPSTNGTLHAESNSKKSKKKKKKGSTAESDTAAASPLTSGLDLPSHSPFTAARGPGISRDKIWSTSSQEERERIKEFWLGLGEDERKSLVKVEKDAVLKKMKEQQKHTCSCTVCGRKRTAIEEELEGLYDAYYLELEQFANQGETPHMLPHSARDLAFRPPRMLPSTYSGRPPSRGRIIEHVGEDEDDEELEEVYSEDEVEEDDYSDEPPEEYHSSHDRDVTDFLTFGNSLQVKGGILTVADDLLKNDGKRFIEMMEQLAERRMAREEDAREHFSRGYGHPNGPYSNPHSHPPPEDEDFEDDEEEDEDYEDSQDEEYEDEEDPMTEEQRMEEGRRMFQIFAARMFEQRVLSAYKEKVAKERQQQLLEELEEESRKVDQQKAKKAKNAQKKKDKAAQKKQALAEEKARKEAEKAAEEAARLEAEKRRVAEQKQKAEEKRKQKEAQRKADEEARLKKEAERQRRLHEQREKQAEQERKVREAKEQEKKLKEEQRLKEKDAREQKEREAQERKDKQERDKREKEARAARLQREAQEAKEAREKAKEQKAKEQKIKEQKAAQNQAAQQGPQPSSQATKRSQQQAVSVPTVLPQHPPNPASYASPKIPVATPVIPKAPTPIRPRTMSQQYETGPSSSSASQSATSQNPSPNPLTPVHQSPGLMMSQRHGSASTAPGHSVSPTSGRGQSTPLQMPPLAMQPPPGLAHHPPPGFSSRIPHEPIFPPGFRPTQNMMMPPPGIGSPGRGFPAVPMPPPGFPQQPAGDQFGLGQGFPLPKDIPPPGHARQSSGGFDVPPGSSPQPIGRPTPIGRPGSMSQGTTSDDQDEDEDDENKHLGSRALLDDDDEPLEEEFNPGSLRNQPPGPRGGFGSSPFVEPGFPHLTHNPWGPQPNAANPFPPPSFGNPGWPAPSIPPGFGMTSPILGLSSIRAPPQSRHVAVRLMLCQACKELSNTVGDGEGYIKLATIKSQIDVLTGDHSITEQDLLNLCDTEGSSTNGGGTFEVKRNVGEVGKHSVRWVPDANPLGSTSPFRTIGAPGEIGSPLAGNASLRGF